MLLLFWKLGGATIPPDIDTRYPIGRANKTEAVTGGVSKTRAVVGGATNDKGVTGRMPN